MTKYEKLAETGDGPTPRTPLDDPIGSTSGTASTVAAPEAPVQYLTRREAREAERRAAAQAPVVVAPAAPAEAEAAVLTADVPTHDAPALQVAAEQAPLEEARAEQAPAQEARTTGHVATDARPAPAGRASGPRARRAAQPTRRSSHQATGARRTSTAAPSRADRAAALPRPTPASSFGRTTKKVTVLGSMLFAGGMLVATSVPALAFQVETADPTAVARTTLGTQSFVADGAAVEGDVTRDGYSVTTPAAQIAKTDPDSFANDVNGSVQWPFPTGVPISSGFGARQVSGCSFCSTFHQGLDFVPGAGTPIQSIADGVVTKVDGPSGALGNNVWIEHTVDGKKVTSVYAHMQTGSVAVTKGETVSVGQNVGKVGSTGNSTGAHLHFEIIIGGVPVDPYPWLTANVN